MVNKSTQQQQQEHTATTKPRQHKKRVIWTCCFNYSEFYWLFPLYNALTLFLLLRPIFNGSLTDNSFQQTTETSRTTQQHPLPSQIPETKQHPLIQPTHGLITTHTRVHHNTHVQIHTTSSSTTHNPYTGSHKTHNPYKNPQTWDPPWSWLHTKHQPIHGFTHHSIPHGFTQNPTPTRLHTSSNPWGMEP